ncbi:MAG: hypothetical protein ABI310_06445 [Microbacteriaceae bacterium]
MAVDEHSDRSPSERNDADPDVELGGDPACWLSLLCPECGAVLESHSEPCWRCGLKPGEERVSS